MFKIQSCNKTHIPIHVLIQQGNFEKVKKYFSKEKNDVNSQNNEGKTALYTAIECKQIKIANYLLIMKNADIDIPTIFGETPLWIAAYNGNNKIVSLLLSLGAQEYINDSNDCNITPLHCCIEQGHYETAKTLLISGAIIDTKIDFMPMHLSAQGNSSMLINLMYELGYDINIKNSNHDTPLHLAVKNNNLEIVARLTDLGANVKLKNRDMLTPLDIANEMSFGISVFLQGLLDKDTVDSINVKRNIIMKNNFQNNEEFVPKDFCCPITIELFVEPVIANDGHTYEKIAIEKWIQKFSLPKSPVTNRYLIDKRLIPNYSIQSQINNYVIPKKKK